VRPNRARPASGYLLLGGREICAFELNGNVLTLIRAQCGTEAVPRGAKTMVQFVRPMSPGTARRELGVLVAAINHALAAGRITRPVPVELPKEPESRCRWLSRSEVAALLWASRTPQARLYMPLFILLGVYTGRRKEAILSLRWPQVDLEGRRIDFELDGRKRTKKQRGAVPIPARLLPHLRRARRRGTEMGYVIHINGNPIQDIKKAFRGACERAGLEVSGPQKVTPHTLRHTAATWLMQAGVDKWEAAGFLAMTTETLERRYGHHHPDYMKRAADAIGMRPRNPVMFLQCSELKCTVEARRIKMLGLDHSPPKAEVRGSNPLGCARRLPPPL